MMSMNNKQYDVDERYTTEVGKLYMELNEMHTRDMGELLLAKLSSARECSGLL